MSELSHFQPDGSARMVDVSDKQVTLRKGVAQALIVMQPATAQKIQSGNAAKGDVLQVARLAGIQATKQTSHLIPLCHLLPLEKVAIDFHWIDDVTLAAVSTVSATAKTGVEMEALVGVTVAALTVYDMCKSIDRSMEIHSVQLLEKSGGQHGDYQRYPTHGK